MTKKHSGKKGKVFGSWSPENKIIGIHSFDRIHLDKGALKVLDVVTDILNELFKIVSTSSRLSEVGGFYGVNNGSRGLVIKMKECISSRFLKHTSF